MENNKFQIFSSDTMLGLVKTMNECNLNHEDIVSITHANNQFFCIFKR